MKTFPVRIAVLVVIIAPLLAFHPTVASAATVTVTVGNNCLCFGPASVTIQPGDTVQWTWSSSGHSSTSGTPGNPNGIWDSGILNQGATFSHTFNTAGSFPYYCTPHGQCCGMTGTVNVASPACGLQPWTIAANYPAVIESTAVSTDGTYAYSAGGLIDVASNGFYRYDLVANTWTTLAPLPT